MEKKIAKLIGKAQNKEETITKIEEIMNRNLTETQTIAELEAIRVI